MGANFGCHYRVPFQGRVPFWGVVSGCNFRVAFLGAVSGCRFWVPFWGVLIGGKKVSIHMGGKSVS